VTSHLTRPGPRRHLRRRRRQAAFFLIGLEVPAYTPPANAAVGAVRDHVAATDLPPGTDAFVTGAAAVAADENVAIESTLARTTWLSLLLVAGILLWVFRSPVAPLVPLTTVAVAFLVSRAVVTLLAQAGMDVSALYETFAVVIVFGAGTDYCLFLLARYREELDGGAAAELGPGEAAADRRADRDGRGDAGGPRLVRGDHDRRLLRAGRGRLRAVPHDGARVGRLDRGDGADGAHARARR
jgi:putative drug exporter of the RND superfamily